MYLSFILPVLKDKKRGPSHVFKNINHTDFLTFNSYLNKLSIKCGVHQTASFSTTICSDNSSEFYGLAT